MPISPSSKLLSMKIDVSEVDEFGHQLNPKQVEKVMSLINRRQATRAAKSYRFATGTWDRKPEITIASSKSGKTFTISTSDPRVKWIDDGVPAHSCNVTAYRSGTYRWTRKGGVTRYHAVDFRGRKAGQFLSRKAIKAWRPTIRVGGMAKSVPGQLLPLPGSLGYWRRPKKIKPHGIRPRMWTSSIRAIIEEEMTIEVSNAVMEVLGFKSSFVPKSKSEPSIQGSTE